MAGHSDDGGHDHHEDGDDHDDDDDDERLARLSPDIIPEQSNAEQCRTPGLRVSDYSAAVNQLSIHPPIYRPTTATRLLPSNATNLELRREGRMTREQK